VCSFVGVTPIVFCGCSCLSFLMRDAQSSWWADRRPKLSRWYKRLTPTHNSAPREELTLSQLVLAKLLVIRTMHGNFAWYLRTTWYTVHECDAGSCSGLRSLFGHQLTLRRVLTTCSNYSATLKTLLTFFALRKEPSSRKTSPQHSSPL